MYQLSFSYPVEQEDIFGNKEAPIPEGTSTDPPERTLGNDGGTFILVNIVTPLAINILATYIYDRYFKPKQPTNRAPIIIYGEEVIKILSVADTIRMIEKLRKTKKDGK